MMEKGAQMTDHRNRADADGDGDGHSSGPGDHRHRLETLITLGEGLERRLREEVPPTVSTNKLNTKIEAELRFLYSLRDALNQAGDGQAFAQTTTADGKLRAPLPFDPKKLATTNLYYLKALIDIAVANKDHAVSILSKVSALDANRVKHTGIVDVILQKGKEWLKVTCRRGLALQRIWDGDASFGKKSIVDVTLDMQQLAQLCPCRGATPTVKVLFLKGVTSTMRSYLTKKGIVVEGTVLEHESNTYSDDSDGDSDEQHASSTYADGKKGSFDDDVDDGDDAAEDEEIYDGSHSKGNEAHSPHKQLQQTQPSTPPPSDACEDPDPILERIRAKDPSICFKDILVADYASWLRDLWASEIGSDKGMDDDAVAKMEAILKTACRPPLSSPLVAPDEDGNHSDGALSALDDLPVFGDSSTFPNKAVHLDVSTCIALVSDTSHGCSCADKLVNPHLIEMAKDEVTNPVLPAIMQAAKGRLWLVCKSAVESFIDILKSIAGPRELGRAHALLQNIFVVKDAESTLGAWLKVTGSIKPRSKLVFSAGDAYDLVTLSSNFGFLRAARKQDVHFKVVLHPWRAMSETHTDRWIRIGKGPRGNSEYYYIRKAELEKSGETMPVTDDVEPQTDTPASNEQD